MAHGPCRIAWAPFPPDRLVDDESGQTPTDLTRELQLTSPTPHLAAAAFDREVLAAPALRSFFAIADKWGLTLGQCRQLLGSPAEGLFRQWERERAGRIPGDVLERISYVLGIYKALHTVFTDASQADSWLKRANAAPLFGGRSALEKMLSVDLQGLRVVREYLDAQAG